MPAFDFTWTPVRGECWIADGGTHVQVRGTDTDSGMGVYVSYTWPEFPQGARVSISQWKRSFRPCKQHPPNPPT